MYNMFEMVTIFNFKFCLISFVATSRNEKCDVERTAFIEVLYVLSVEYCKTIAEGNCTVRFYFLLSDTCREAILHRQRGGEGGIKLSPCHVSNCM